MKKNFLFITLIFSVLLLAVVSCKRSDPDPEPTPGPHIIYPEPGPNGTLPVEILPESLSDSVSAHFTIYNGENPPIFDGQFISHPHMLLHTTVPNDTILIYNDRYVAFFGNNEYMDFYGKQWDDQDNAYYEEAYRKLYVLGTGDSFTCYYLTEGYPNGMFAQQSTVFSGKWAADYGGLRDFQVAVILLETSGNPNLAPPGSYRVLGDGDGLAEDTAWMASKRSISNEKIMTAEDAFSMFRVK